MIRALTPAGIVLAAMLARMRRHYAARGWPDFTEASVEAIGAEDTYGARARSARRDAPRAAAHRPCYLCLAFISSANFVVLMPHFFSSSTSLPVDRSRP